MGAWNDRHAGEVAAEEKSKGNNGTKPI